MSFACSVAHEQVIHFWVLSIQEQFGYFVHSNKKRAPLPLQQAFFGSELFMEKLHKVPRTQLVDEIAPGTPKKKENNLNSLEKVYKIP